MSQITENTVLLKRELNDKMNGIVLNHSNEVKNFVSIAVSEDYLLAVFDFNGEPDIFNGIEYSALETNYLDGEPLHTEYRDEDGRLQESDKPLTDILSKFIKNEYNLNLAKSVIKYSDSWEK